MLKRMCVSVLLFVAMACGGSGGSTTPPTPSTPTTPTPTTFSLSGRVTDSATSNGIAGATVSIADSANAGKSATTDASGSYSFTGLQQAGFTVNATAAAYVSLSKGVTLTSNQTLNFALAQQSFTGSWRGTTTQQGNPAVAPITFTVNSANEMTRLTVGWEIAGCTRQDYGILPNSRNPVPIVAGNSFTFDLTFSSAPGLQALTMRGTLGSASTASGTVTIRFFNPQEPARCSGTFDLVWTATKQ